MPPKSEAKEPRRRNRVVGAGEAVAPALDAVLRRRGFASRDLVANWAAIVPVPYGTVTAPDRLAWPRGERGAGGATLYVRCVPAHALALSHEGALIAAAINRYFGYVLVDSVRLSAAPLSKAAPKAEATQLVEEAPPAVTDAVSRVDDDQLRAALSRLGKGVFRRKNDA